MPAGSAVVPEAQITEHKKKKKKKKKKSNPPRLMLDVALSAGALRLKEQERDLGRGLILLRYTVLCTMWSNVKKELLIKFLQFNSNFNYLAKSHCLHVTALLQSHLIVSSVSSLHWSWAYSCILFISYVPGGWWILCMFMCIHAEGF